MKTDLDDQVRAALVARKGDWPAIAAKVKVSHSWISQFVRNKIDNPGYLTLKKLHAHLAPDSEEATQAIAEKAQA